MNILLTVWLANSLPNTSLDSRRLYKTILKWEQSEILNSFSSITLQQQTFYSKWELWCFCFPHRSYRFLPNNQHKCSGLCKSFNFTDSHFEYKDHTKTVFILFYIKFFITDSCPQRTDFFAHIQSLFVLNTFSILDTNPVASEIFWTSRINLLIYFPNNLSVCLSGNFSLIA
jgi:hypothetical protein